MSTIKYIAYCRKSTDEPDRQILSIEVQVAELKEHAAKEGLKIISFITESKTAKEPGRAIRGHPPPRWNRFATLGIL